MGRASAPWPGRGLQLGPATKDFLLLHLITSGPTHPRSAAPSQEQKQPLQTPALVLRLQALPGGASSART